jgi:hypothetical protein
MRCGRKREKMRDTRNKLTDRIEREERKIEERERDRQ